MKTKPKSKKELRYTFISHAIRHRFTFREIGKMLNVSQVYVHQVYHSKPLPKTNEKKLCAKCKGILKYLTKM